MRLIHLPTLDGSVEAAVDRLDAFSRLQDTYAIEDGLWQAQSIVNDMVTDEDYSRQSRLRSVHEAVLTDVQHEVDRLVSS